MKKYAKNYELAVINLLKAFAKKHELYFDAIIDTNFVAGIYTVSDYFVNIELVYIDLLFEVPKETFFQWYDYSMQGGEINFYSWCNGLRPENLAEHKAKSLAKSKTRAKEAKKTLISTINSDIFAEIKAKMTADKVSKSELARRLNRTPQQIGKILKSGNATLTTINKIKKALNYGN